MKALDYQIQLQEEMQQNGLNLVCCNDCCAVLIHKDEDEKIICPSCLEEQHVNDYCDLYYNGCYSPEETN